jgi:hypothetical protein
MKTDRSLLVRPKWIVGESWTGYLLRVAERNSLAGIEGLARCLGMTTLKIMFAQPAIVLRMMGVRSQGVPTIYYPRARRARRIFMRMSGRASPSAMCLECLRQDRTPHIRAIWEMPLELGCRLHGVELNTKCADCGRPIHVRRLQLLTCPCGASYLDQQDRPIDPVWMQMLHALDIRRPEQSKQTFAIRAPRELLAVSLVEKLLNFDVQLAAAAPRRKSYSGARLAAEAFERVKAWFQDWPASFTARYASSKTEILRGGRPRPYLSSCGLHAREFPKLQAAIHSISRREISSPRPWMRITHEQLLQRPLQPVSAAAILAGCAETTIHCAVRTGFIAGPRYTPEGALRLETAEILRFKALLESTLTPQEAAVQLGVVAQVVMFIMRSGFLNALHIGQRFYDARVQTTECAQLRESFLKRVSVSRAPIDERCELARAILLAGNRCDMNVAFLLSSLLRGELSMYSRTRDPRDLRSVFILEHERQGFMRELMR